MNSSALNFLGTVFSAGWAVLNSFYIPGTQVTPGALLAAFMFLPLVMRIIRRLLKVDSEES